MKLPKEKPRKWHKGKTVKKTRWHKGKTQRKYPIIVRMLAEFGEDFEEVYFHSIGW
mgnify:CR=1 FL=1